MTIRRVWRNGRRPQSGGGARVGRPGNEHGDSVRPRSAGSPEREGRDRRGDGARHEARHARPAQHRARANQLGEIEKAKGADLKFDHIMEQVAGAYPRVMVEGQMDAGAWSCGMVVGLIRDIPTVQELIDRIMEEADHLITQRLAGFLESVPA